MLNIHPTKPPMVRPVIECLIHLDTNIFSWGALVGGPHAEDGHVDKTNAFIYKLANWGQDWEETMLKNAPTVFAADPLENIIFSVHMYQIYNNRSIIDNYLSTFINEYKTESNTETDTNTDINPTPGCGDANPGCGVE